MKDHNKSGNTANTRTGFPVGRYLSVGLLVLSSMSLLGQSTKMYEMDSVKIYFNQNLNSFLSCINHDYFQTYNNKNSIPPFITEQLDYFAGGFSLANPKEQYQCCCTSPMTLPRRKLDFLSISNNVFVMTYLTGGIAVEEHILLIKFERKRIVDIWYGLADYSLHSLRDIAKYVSRRKKNPQDLHMNLDL
jgi:hypothetical protein